MDELDRDVTRVRARLGRVPDCDQAASAPEALGHEVTQSSERLGGLRKVPLVRLSAQGQQLVETIGLASVVLVVFGAFVVFGGGRPAGERLGRVAHAEFACARACAGASRATAASHCENSCVPSPVRALTSMCSTSGLT